MNRVNSFHKNFISTYMLLGNLQKEIFERKIHLKNIYIFIIIIISSHNDLIYIISLIKVKFAWKHVRISINQYKRKLYCAKRKRIDTKKNPLMYVYVAFKIHLLQINKERLYNKYNRIRKSQIQLKKI